MFPYPIKEDILKESNTHKHVLGNTINTMNKVLTVPTVQKYIGCIPTTYKGIQVTHPTLTSLGNYIYYLKCFKETVNM